MQTRRSLRKEAIDANTPLTPRERAFVAQYITHWNGSKAAAAIGHRNGPGIYRAGSQILGQPHIQAEINRQIDERVARLKLDADRVVQDIDAVANVDVAELCDEKGRLLRLWQMPPHVRRAIVGIDFDQHHRVTKVRLVNKAKMLEILAKHLGLYSDAPIGDRPHEPAFALPPDSRVSIH